MNKRMEKPKNELTKRSDSGATLLEMRLDANRFPRLRRYSREEAIFQMSKIVSQAFLYKGQMADDNNIQYISAALVDELREDDAHGAQNICFAEISKVVKRAVLAEELFGISVASLYKVIMDYVKGEGTRLQNEANEIEQRRRLNALKTSGVNPMILAATGQFIKSNKI